MGNFSQKMRCGNCGHSAETEDMPIEKAKDFYTETAKSMRMCPNCKQRKYALSAYNAEGLKVLRQKCIEHNFDPKGAWYCDENGKL